MADRVFRKRLTRLEHADDLALLEQLGLPTLVVCRVEHRTIRKAARIFILGLLNEVVKGEAWKQAERDWPSIRHLPVLSVAVVASRSRPGTAATCCFSSAVCKAATFSLLSTKVRPADVALRLSSAHCWQVQLKHFFWALSLESWVVARASLALLFQPFPLPLSSLLFGSTPSLSAFLPLPLPLPSVAARAWAASMISSPTVA